MLVPAARAAPIPSPGATTSGLTAKSPTRGPRLENPLTRSALLTLPTANAESAAAGLLTDNDSPSFPAETTNKVPCCSERRSTARDRGSVPSVAPPPRLRLTTLARGAAHSIAARTADSSQVSAAHTLPTSNRASLATPPKTPRPATVAATCVPCPYVSSTPLPVKSLASNTFPCKSGCAGSYPPSSTATVTPFPVSPSPQATGAPICGKLSASINRTRPSSHTFRTPSSRLMPSHTPARALLASARESRSTINGSVSRLPSSRPCPINAVTSNNLLSTFPPRTSRTASCGTTCTCPSAVRR